jgi:8-oxo-dGTP pyrophosphatase MutT (NUDIX family)
VQRTIRYQAAIVRDGHLLLIQAHVPATGQRFWLLPGGGIEPGEAEDACVRREVMEETHLRVEVIRPLMETPDIPGGIYQTLRTYLCHVIDGEARPGIEPEDEAVSTITAVCWFDLRDPASWDTLILDDPITYPTIQAIREALGLTVTGV